MTKPRVTIAVLAAASLMGLLASRRSFVSPHRDVVVLSADGSATVKRPAYVPPKSTPAPVTVTTAPAVLAEGGSSEGYDPTQGATISFTTWAGYHSGGPQTLKVSEVSRVEDYRTAAGDEGCVIYVGPYTHHWYCKEPTIDVVNRLLAARWKTVY